MLLTFTQALAMVEHAVVAALVGAEREMQEQVGPHASRHASRTDWPRYMLMGAITRPSCKPGERYHTILMQAW